MKYQKISYKIHRDIKKTHNIYVNENTYDRDMCIYLSI